MRGVLTLFCLGTALAAFRTLPSLVSFYAWFKDCGLEISRHRGFGQSACPAFGIWRPPKLSVATTQRSGVTFVVSLLTACAAPQAWPATRVISLLVALAAYFLFFSQLYCEAHVGAHVTVLIPPALILLIATPAMDPGVDAPAAAAAAVLTCWLMKVIITSAYCGAGISKVHSSLKARSGGWWWSGPTMQACIFEGLFVSNPEDASSFGVPTPFTNAIQRFVVQHPRTLCAPLSAGSVAFECLAPLVLFLPANPASLVFAVAGIGFHYGICLMQNIDFVSWWAPAYAFFVLDAAAGSNESWATASSTWHAFNVSWEIAPIRTAIAVGYVALHLIACVVLRFFPEIELLPFSAFPMYSDLKNLHDPSLRATVYMTEKPHKTGTLKNYCFPFCRPKVVRKDELDALPFKYLAMRHGGGEDVEVMTNVEAGPGTKLAAALENYRGLTSAEPAAARAEAARHPARRARALTVALDEARRAFREAPRRCVVELGVLAK